MEVKRKSHQKFELLPPEGGWGYIVAIALTLMVIVTIIPMTSFGLIFGKFLSRIGDETTGTTLANGVFNTCYNVMGLVANSLLRRYTYRVVAFLGAAIYFVGSFSTIFITTLPQMIISFGVIQGVGMGLMLPAFFTAFQFYFDKRLSLMNSIAQTFMVAASMFFPLLAEFLVVHLGFRGTVALISAASLNCILAAAVLQPVEWHMKKKRIIEEKEDFLFEGRVHSEKYTMPKPRTSIISLGDRAMSVTTLNKSVTTLNKSGGFLNKTEENTNWWSSLYKSMDLGMFKDPIYVNICVGLSLGFTSDMAFISIIPLVLINSGFDSKTTAFLISVFFGADVIARILLSLISLVSRFRNRYYFLIASYLLVIFRTAFTLRNDFHWKVITIASVGFLRCFIQTPLPLVISEEYSHNFATAFSLYMVVCGLVSLLFGPLMSFVKTYSHSDVMVVHLLSLAYLVCAVSWTIELVWKRLQRKK